MAEQTQVDRPVRHLLNREYAVQEAIASCAKSLRHAGEEADHRSMPDQRIFAGPLAQQIGQQRLEDGEILIDLALEGSMIHGDTPV
ncbi:MAG: hypothetical protein PGN09_08430 [Sphingomonas fennica]